MAGKRVLLTIEPRIYDILRKEADVNFMSVQEIISDMLRKWMIAKTHPARKSKAGRPPKVDEPFLEYFSRKR